MSFEQNRSFLPVADDDSRAEPAGLSTRALLSEGDIEALLNTAAAAAEKAAVRRRGRARGAEADATTAELPDLKTIIQGRQVSSIELLGDVELEVRIELGRSRMFVEDVLKLDEGSVVELDKLAGDPVEIFVNDTLVARGEVLILNDNFCVRVSEIVSSPGEEP